MSGRVEWAPATSDGARSGDPSGTCPDVPSPCAVWLSRTHLLVASRSPSPPPRPLHQSLQPSPASPGMECQHACGRDVPTKQGPALSLLHQQHKFHQSSIRLRKKQPVSHR